MSYLIGYISILTSVSILLGDLTRSDGQFVHLPQEASCELDQLPIRLLSGGPVPGQLIDSDGWVCMEGKLVFWVPEECRNGLISDAVMTIPTTGHSKTVRVDLSRFRYGTSWTAVYKELQGN